MDPSQKAKLLNQYLKRIYGSLDEAVEDIQSTSASASVESLGFDGGSFNEETLGLIRSGRFDDLNRQSIERTEAVIHSETGKRPAFPIIEGSFESPSGFWAELGSQNLKPKLEESIASIGRLELPDDWSRKYGGTAFVVGEGLLMTNRHVARLFSFRRGSRTVLFQRSEIDFRREVPRRGQIPPTAFDVEDVLLVHPYWDMAILKVTAASGNGTELPNPLSLHAGSPEEFFNTSVAIVGYPGFDSRGNVELQNRIFHRYGFKRLQPGVLREFADYESDEGFSVENALDHDCSTLGGNSGSALMLLTDAAAANEQAPVVGLHFAGDYLDKNYAVPTNALASDQRLVDAGVNFVGNLPTPSVVYPSLWRIADSATEQTPSTSSRLEGSFSEHQPSRDNLHFSMESIFVDEPFSWTAALSCALASHLAYVRDPTAVSNVAKSEWGFAECKLIAVDNIECVVAKTDGVIVVAFRGTELSLRDWLTDINLFSRSRPYGKVHRGFHAGFEAVRAEIEAELGQTAGIRLVLTGHSLGGALATIAAAEWSYLSSHTVSGVYTFGQPAVGKGDFPNFIQQTFGERFVRVVNDDDIVARVPPTYNHVGKLIQFRPSDSSEETPQADSSEMLTLDQFNRMRISLLQSRLSGLDGSGESSEEGFFPSFRDHAINNYISRLLHEAGIIT